MWRMHRVSRPGGGLAAGIASALLPGVDLVPVEPAACPTLAAALAAGRPARVEVGGVAVDSLGAPQLGNLAFEVLSRSVDRVVTVEEAKGTETTMEVVEGLQFDRGYLSPYFVTDAEKMEAVLEEALI